MVSVVGFILNCVRHFVCSSAILLWLQFVHILASLFEWVTGDETRINIFINVNGFW